MDAPSIAVLWIGGGVAYLAFHRDIVKDLVNGEEYPDAVKAIMAIVLAVILSAIVATWPLWMADDIIRHFMNKKRGK